MLRTSTRKILGLGFALACSTSANAAPVVNGSFRGIITEGTVTLTSFFGDATKVIDLTGRQFNVTFHAVAQTDLYPDDAASYNSFVYNYFSGRDLNFGFTSALMNTGESYFYGDANSGYESLSYSGNDDSEENFYLSYAGASNKVGPVVGGGSAGIFRQDSYFGLPDREFNFSFNLIRGSVTTDGSSTSAVPEPATWALMIAGFGLVGAAMRRKGLQLA